MLWRKWPERIAKVGVEGSNPFARSNFSFGPDGDASRLGMPRRLVRLLPPRKFQDFLDSTLAHQSQHAVRALAVQSCWRRFRGRMSSTSPFERGSVPFG